MNPSRVVFVLLAATAPLLTNGCSGDPKAAQQQRPPEMTIPVLAATAAREPAPMPTPMKIA